MIKELNASTRIGVVVLLLLIIMPVNFFYVAKSMRLLNDTAKIVETAAYTRGGIQRIAIDPQESNTQRLVRKVDEKFTYITDEYVARIDFSDREYASLAESIFEAYSCWNDFKELLNSKEYTKIPAQSELCWHSSDALTQEVRKAEERIEQTVIDNLRMRIGVVLILLVLLSYISLKSVRGELEKNVKVDRLTNLYNRQYFNEQLKRYIVTAKRHQEALSLIFIDIDFFKNINDTHGHQVGDSVLQEVATLMLQELRSTDSAYRYGGEEFVVIATRTNAKEARTLSERFRKVVENHNFTHIKHLTVSIGITELKENDSVDALIKRADDAMYMAKHDGRNQVKMV